MEKRDRFVSEDLGLAIKMLRKKQNLSLNDLQERTGVSASYINRLEKGSRNSPTIPIIKMLAEGLNTDMDTLLGISSTEKEGKNIYDLIIQESIYLNGVMVNKNKKTVLLNIIKLITSANNKDTVEDRLDLFIKLNNFINKLIVEKEVLE